MRSFSFIILVLFLSSQAGLAQGASPDALEQTKRNLRKQNHIEKKLQGQIIGHVFAGKSKALSAFVFKSDAGKYYHVKISGWQGEAMMPFLVANENAELTVTGDAVLLERLLYPEIRYQYVENLFGIRLNGLAHFKSIKTAKGTYTHAGNRPLSAQKDQSELVKEAEILKKYKTNDNRWAFVLGNDDTLYIRNRDEDMGPIKGLNAISYVRSIPTIMNFGVYYHAPNSYYGVRAPYLDAMMPYDVMDQLRGQIAVIVEKGIFTLIENKSDGRGLFNGMEVNVNGAKTSLFFDAKNGEKVQEQLNGAKKFTAYYNSIGEDSLLLYALENGGNQSLIDNRTQRINNNPNYEQETVTFTGKISNAHFIKTNRRAKLKYFIVNDSVHVAVGEIVAINIQEMIREGREVSVTGYLRKDNPGEVNMRGYQIMAANAITIKGKTFRQQLRNYKSML